MKTKDSDFEYYLIGSDYKATTPLLRADGDQSTWFLVNDKPLDLTEYKKSPVRLCFNSPIPKKIIMTDFHSLPDSVISKKISQAFRALNVYGMQLIPSVVRNNNTNETYPDYSVIYIYNRVQCLDMKHAGYSVDEDDGKVDDIAELVLDKGILSKIPLENRLVFLMKEDRSKRIYHKSVVDTIMSVNPDGIVFGKIAMTPEST